MSRMSTRREWRMLAARHRQAKYLNNREEMNQALTNFTDAHNSLIQNKDDYMNNQTLAAELHYARCACNMRNAWS